MCSLQGPNQNRMTPAGARSYMLDCTVLAMDDWTCTRADSDNCKGLAMNDWKRTRADTEKCRELAMTAWTCTRADSDNCKGLAMTAWTCTRADSDNCKVLAMTAWTCPCWHSLQHTSRTINSARNLHAIPVQINATYPMLLHRFYGVTQLHRTATSDNSHYQHTMTV